MRRLGIDDVRIGMYLSMTLFALSACSSPISPSSEITGERAIELARQHVSFEPTGTAAEMDSRQGRPVWVVTFQARTGAMADSASSPRSPWIAERENSLLSL